MAYCWHTIDSSGSSSGHPQPLELANYNKLCFAFVNDELTSINYDSAGFEPMIPRFPEPGETTRTIGKLVITIIIIIILINIIICPDRNEKSFQRRRQKSSQFLICQRCKKRTLGHFDKRHDGGKKFRGKK